MLLVFVTKRNGGSGDESDMEMWLEHVLEKEIGWRELWEPKEEDTRGTRGQ